MKCKDIPDIPVLRFLEQLVDRQAGQLPLSDQPSELSVLHAMPSGTPPKLARAKMRKLIGRGLVEGCACGCRGDFRLTDLGRMFLDRPVTHSFDYANAVAESLPHLERCRKALREAESVLAYMRRLASAKVWTVHHQLGWNAEKRELIKILTLDTHHDNPTEHRTEATD